MEETWTVLRVLQWTTDYFKRKGLLQPRADAEVLLAHVLKTERIQLYLRFDQPLGPHELAAYRDAVRRRAGREPAQYITGKQEFWSLDLEVSPAVLIPRPETELLVELGLKILSKPRAKVLDLCTGSGAIALALATEREDLRIVATDKSCDAIALARRNAARNGLEHRVHFVAMDLFSALQPSGVRFDCILSNPPYVGDDEIPTLAPEIRDHEPMLALKGGGARGTAIIARILDAIQSFLEPGGSLLVEIGANQKEHLEKLIQSLPDRPAVSFHKDYAGLTRILQITTENR